MNTESRRTTDSVDTASDVLGRYADMVYRLAFARTKSRYDAEDILQEVFLRYIRHAPECRDEEHRRAWLIRATINCSKTLLTSAWFCRTVPMEDTLVTEIQEKSEVYYAVLALPARYRTVIHLYYYEDYPVAQIGTLLGCGESTVKSRLHRARKLLRDKLKGEAFDVS